MHSPITVCEAECTDSPENWVADIYDDDCQKYTGRYCDQYGDDAGTGGATARHRLSSVVMSKESMHPLRLAALAVEVGAAAGCAPS